MPQENTKRVEAARRALTAYTQTLPGANRTPDGPDTIRDLVADVCHLLHRNGYDEPVRLVLDGYNRFYLREVTVHLMAELNEDGGRGVPIRTLVRSLLELTAAVRGEAVAERAADALVSATDDFAAAAETLQGLVTGLLRG